MNLFRKSPNSINSLGVLKLQLKRKGPGGRKLKPLTTLTLIKWKDNISQTSARCTTNTVERDHSEIMLVSIDKTGNLNVIWNNKTVNFECAKNKESIWPGETGLQKSVTLVNLIKYDNDESFDFEQLKEYINFHYEFLHKPSKSIIITFPSIS